MTRSLLGGRGSAPEDPGALPTFVRGVGHTSLLLAGVGLLAPRALAAAGGVRTPEGEIVPVLVRMAAARQALIGLAVLTRRPTDVARSAGLFLPLTTLDAVAVLAGVRTGALHPRSGVMSLAVLAGNLAVLRRVRR